MLFTWVATNSKYYVHLVLSKTGLCLTAYIKTVKLFPKLIRRSCYHHIMTSIKNKYTLSSRDKRKSRLFCPKIAIFNRLYIKFVANNGKNRDSAHATISFCPCCQGTGGILVILDNFWKCLNGF